MEKIYVVTRGEYSDYEICAMFTEKELAQAYIDSFTGYMGFNDIEEYELNPYKNDLIAGRIPFYLKMDIEGNTIKLNQTDSTYGFNDGAINISFTYGEKPLMIVRCFAKNEEHAIKIANEKRVQYIVANIWGKDNETL